MAFLRVSPSFVIVAIKDVIDVFSRVSGSKHFRYKHDFYKETCTVDEVIDSATFSPTSKYFAALFSDKSVVVWSMDSSNYKPWIKLGVLHVNRRSTSLCFSPSEDVIYVGDKSGDVCSFTLSDSIFGSCPKNVEPILGHISIVLDVSVTEKYVISADRDEKIRISNRMMPHIIQSFCLGHTQFVCRVLHIEENSLVSTSGDGTLRLWNLDDGRQIQSLSVNGESDSNSKNVTKENGDGQRRRQAVPSLLAYAVHIHLLAVACEDTTNGIIEFFQVDLSETCPIKKAYTITFPSDTTVFDFAFSQAESSSCASLYILTRFNETFKIETCSCYPSKQETLELTEEMIFANSVLANNPNISVVTANYAQLFKNTIPGHTYDQFYEKKKQQFKKQCNSAKKPKLDMYAEK